MHTNTASVNQRATPGMFYWGERDGLDLGMRRAEAFSVLVGSQVRHMTHINQKGAPIAARSSITPPRGPRKLPGPCGLQTAQPACRGWRVWRAAVLLLGSLRFSGNPAAPFIPLRTPRPFKLPEKVEACTFLALSFDPPPF